MGTEQPRSSKAASRRRCRTTRAGWGMLGPGVLPGRADGSPRAAGRPTCSRATTTPPRASRSRSGTSRLRIDAEATVAVCGAETDVTVDRRKAVRALGEPSHLPAGTELQASASPRARAFAVRRILGRSRSCRCSSARARPTPWALSEATRAGRCSAGDVLPLGDEPDGDGKPPASGSRRASGPTYTREWEIEAMRGPQAAPDYLTEADMRACSSGARGRSIATRTAPASGSSRISSSGRASSGGVAGGHPSNILDNSYPVGAVNVNGDLPVILGPDGPTAGGFVCAATVIHAGFWKIGQLRPVGDSDSLPRGVRRRGAELDRDLERLPRRDRGGTDHPPADHRSKENDGRQDDQVALPGHVLPPPEPGGRSLRLGGRQRRGR